MSKPGDTYNEIKKYLNGKLDARAMHQLERRAQDDPFLMDALEGYEKAGGNQDDNLQELSDRLLYRIERRERRIIPMRVISIAASILLLLGIGLFWYFNQGPVSEQKEKIAVNIQKPVEKKTFPQIDTAKTTSVAANAVKAAAFPPPADIKYKHYYAAAKKASPVPLPAVARVAFPPPVVKPDAGYSSNANVDTAKNKSPELNELVVTEYTAMQQKAKKSADKAGLLKVDTTWLGGKTLTGVVKNGTEPLQGVVVQIQGTNLAKLTDSQGKFMFKSVPDKAMLDFERPGYKPLQVPFKKDSMVVAMQSAGLVANPAFGKVSRVRVNGKDYAGYVAPDGQSVKGTVKDSAGPIPGAVVSIRGTDKKTVTDANGNFTLYAVPDGAVVIASSIGYETQELPADRQNALNIMLYPNTTSLAEVSVVKDSSTQARPHPVKGWDNYNYYLKQKAISPDGKHGQVRLTFTVNRNNAISDIKVTKGISAQTDSTAVKLLKIGPAWRMGTDTAYHKARLNIKFRVSK